ncbi:MAG: DUF131 domain-containing protein [Candidatus Thorarchaeota archaeon]
MIQTSSIIQTAGFFILIIGILMIIAGLTSALIGSRSQDDASRRESKGVIFLGPIPIVWGFGKRGWAVAGAMGVALILIWIFMQF